MMNSFSWHEDYLKEPASPDYDKAEVDSSRQIPSAVYPNLQPPSFERFYPKEISYQLSHKTQFSYNQPSGKHQRYEDCTI